MRRRGLRVFFLIAVIVGLSIATLSFREVHISVAGASIDADGNGPLGLRLGLDLQGGSHLMYQADLPDKVEVVFQDPVEESQIRDLLGEVGQTRATVAVKSFEVSDLSLEKVAQDQLREALGEFSPIEDFELVSTGDRSVAVLFGDEVEEAGLRQVLEDLGHTEATLLSPDQKSFVIGELSLVEVALGGLRQGLEATSLVIEGFETGDGILSVSYLVLVQESEVRSALNDAGYTDVTIAVPAQARYSLGRLSLDKTKVENFKQTLAELATIDEAAGGFIPTIDDPAPEDMDNVLNILQRRINALGTTDPLIQKFGDDQIIIQLPGLGASNVDVLFRSVQIVLGEIGLALRQMGHTSPNIVPSAENAFVITTESALSQEDKDTLGELAGTLRVGASLDIGEDDKEITLTFPPEPNETVIRNVLSDLGITDFSVQRQDQAARFNIRTDEALTEDQETRIREAFEERLGEVLSLQVTGGIERAKRLIGETAQLVFKERECLSTLDEVIVNPGLCAPVERGGAGLFDEREIPEGNLTGQDLARAFPGRDPTTRQHEVNLEFKGRGTGIWSDLTKRLVGNQLMRIAIYLDDRQITAPVVTGHSPDGRTRITGNFTREEARDLAAQLESGRLPVPLTLIRESTVDALLGADSLRKSLIAGLLGLGLVLLFMVAYYRLAGLVAATSLLVYAVIVLAILKLVPVTLNLSGIAGLVLSIGMAVDANILIFERMKEEMRTGRSLASAVDVGFRRAWVAIRDSNVSTIGTCAVLFLFGSRLGGGTPVITGLAVTLMIGVLVSMFTSYMLSRHMLQILALTPAGKRLSLFTPETRRQPVGIAGGGK